MKKLRGGREMRSLTRDGSSVARYSVTGREIQSLEPWKPEYFNYIIHRAVAA
jgi:hypothetical protein